MFRTLTRFLGRPPARPAEPAPRFRPAVEGLEGRALMAAHLTATGLQVDGTAGNDTISVRAVTVNGVVNFEVRENGRATRFRADQVPDRNVFVSGLAGNDRITIGTARANAYAFGGDGNDTLTGGSGHDQLFGGAGDDLANGLGGNDNLGGGEGTDSLYGGAGNDGLYGDTGDDQLSGGDGADSLSGWDGADNLYGDAGSDQLSGDGGEDLLHGGTGDDILSGGDAGDRLDGGDGRDAATGDAGDDSVRGGAGDDTVFGGTGNDFVYGDAGADHVRGEGGADHVYGGAGADWLYGDAGDDVLVSIDGEATPDAYLNGGAGSDRAWTDRAGGERMADWNTFLDAPGLAVDGFANGADLSLDGDRTADPTDWPVYNDFRQMPRAGSRFTGAPLFGAGRPLPDDVKQGREGDCWLMAALSGIARGNREGIQRNVVDLGDGTYAVRLGGRVYRVDSDLPTSSSTGWDPVYAGLGAGNGLWVAVVEKAYALHRTGTNTYSSLSSGFASEAYRDLGGRDFSGQVLLTTYQTDLALGNAIEQKLTFGYAVGLVVNQRPAGLPQGGHEYTVVAVNRDAAGTPVSLTVRNPWGIDGTGANPDGNPNDGYITVSLASLRAVPVWVEWAAV